LEIDRHLLDAQSFVFPSPREFGGGVLVEAMASGLPAIVVDYGGPGEIVTDACGIRLPMNPREPLIGQLSGAMTTLLSDWDLCRTMSARAIERVREGFSWPRKAAQVAASIAI
jgi:glycosyltransferase involved in cell wall biosynthesis